MQIAPVSGVLSAAALEAQPVPTLAERQLFDYLAEVEKRGAGHLTDQSALFDSVVHSVDSFLQHVQKAFGDPTMSTGQDAAGVKANVGSASGSALAQAPSTSAGKNGGAAIFNSMDRLIEETKSTMLDLFSAQLAVNATSAATGTVNSLIKQQ